MKTTTLTTLAFILAVVITLSGCNTIKGVGQDVSATGRSVTQGAGSVQKSM
ncbi:MAG: entericidin A/B family lipoprotein [Verrucomicrobia bacterium]|nr:MAG: entericidin A/B family lipoprotein [Verrucomicrobiota bacterium]